MFGELPSNGYVDCTTAASVRVLDFLYSIRMYIICVDLSSAFCSVLVYLV